MKTVRPLVGLSIILLTLPVGLGRAAAPAVEPAPLPEAGTLIQLMVERASLVSSNQFKIGAFYYRTNITEELSSHGDVREKTIKVFRIHPAPGDPDPVLIQIDGRKPTEKEIEKEKERLERRRKDADVDDAPDRSRQIEAYVTLEILSRFIFEVKARDIINGRPCWLVTFRPGDHEKSDRKVFDRVLNNIGGVIWIDAEDHELVQADIQLREKVKIWGGLIAHLEQLSLKILRTRLPEGFWRDQKVEALFRGRALVKGVHIRTFDISSPIETVGTNSLAEGTEP